MATVTEHDNLDAPAATDTPYRLAPGDTFEGALADRLDEDWVRVELRAGHTYQLRLGGLDADAGLDTVLTVYDAGGEQVAINDDVNFSAGQVNSMLAFTPDADGVYFLSAGAYRGNPDLEITGRYRLTLLDEAAIVTMTRTGTDGADTLTGGPGDDTLDGRGGNDWLAGGPGADALSGGPGFDAASYAGSDAGVTVRLYDGTATGGHAEGDTFPGTKTIAYTDRAGATRSATVSDIEYLDGSEHNDILAGDRGPNRLEGRGGNDRLDGREGDDRLEGEAGADTLLGGPGEDTASYRYSDAGVTVRLHNHTARGGHAEGDTFGAVRIDGVALPDVEHLRGSDHADVLAGDGRDNRLDGGPGNDTLYGGPRGGDDRLNGGAGDDRLYGGMGQDTLDGGPGDDTLYGGRDNDRLNGGAGEDIFVFAPGGGDDTVLDFGRGNDRVDLTAFTDLRSITDLVLQPQAGDLVIDLSAQGGGAVTLEDVEEADITAAQFVFFNDAAATMA